MHDIHIAIVVSEFNQPITNQLLHGTHNRLNQLGIAPEQIKTVKVPGAVEIPLAAKLLAKTKRYHAIICLGAVIRGETGHYDYVCQQVSYGCQKIMLEAELPIIFGVLTTDNVAQALDRVGGNHGHKGEEAADAALAMIKLIQGLGIVRQ